MYVEISFHFLICVDGECSLSSARLHLTLLCKHSICIAHIPVLHIISDYSFLSDNLKLFVLLDQLDLEYQLLYLQP